MAWSKRAKAKTNTANGIGVGDRVRLLFGPWAGHEGKYIGDRAGFKLRHVVRLDNREEAFVTSDDQWERVVPAGTQAA